MFKRKALKRKQWYLIPFLVLIVGLVAAGCGTSSSKKSSADHVSLQSKKKKAKKAKKTHHTKKAHKNTSDAQENSASASNSSSDTASGKTDTSQSHSTAASASSNQGQGSQQSSSSTGTNSNASSAQEQKLSGVYQRVIADVIKTGGYPSGTSQSNFSLMTSQSSGVVQIDVSERKTGTIVGHYQWKNNTLYAFDNLTASYRKVN